LELKLENPVGVSQPLDQYSQSVEVPAGARPVFVSGQVPVRCDGTPVAGLAEQADQVYANIVSVLASKGIAPSAIIKLTTFLVTTRATLSGEPDKSTSANIGRPRRLSGLAVSPIRDGRSRLEPSRWL
jgi:enamine deaminase RidA (YjgF/YER057c/UK114 family)